MPLARHDLLLLCGIDSLVYFYSHASCEAWQTEFERTMKCTYFYSHASCEAWLSFVFVWPKIFLFLLTCLLRGMTLMFSPSRSPGNISTHMPLARHDLSLPEISIPRSNFYSHASCEAWHSTGICAFPRQKFLLTCLLRGMTASHFLRTGELVISTHMPLARHDRRLTGWTVDGLTFLLTCLLRGMTAGNLTDFRCYNRFLLTCLLRGMTQFLFNNFCNGTISTHMPLARHDLLTTTFANSTKHFYSHASCEAWRVLQASPFFLSNFYSHASCEAWLSFGKYIIASLKFLLTCLLRGMTILLPAQSSHQIISTHMPLARHDVDNEFHFCPYCGFLLTCLLRGMTGRPMVCPFVIWISTHMPLARHDSALLHSAQSPKFLLTCLLRGMTHRIMARVCHGTISTHMPLARHD